MLTRLSFLSSVFATPGSPLKSSCASYPALADAFFYAQGKIVWKNKITKSNSQVAFNTILESAHFPAGKLSLESTREASTNVIQKRYNIHASHQNLQNLYQNQANVEGFKLLELKFVELFMIEIFGLNENFDDNPPCQ